jgi:hypothetical protein
MFDRLDAPGSHPAGRVETAIRNNPGLCRAGRECLVRLSEAKSNPRDGLVGGIAQSKMLRLSGAKSHPRDGLAGGIAQSKMLRPSGAKSNPRAGLADGVPQSKVVPLT